MVGLAALVISGIIGFTSFMEWGRLAYTYTASDGKSGPLRAVASLSGFGEIDVDIPGITSTTERQLVERQEADALLVGQPLTSGALAAVLGVLLAGAAAGYLWTRFRTFAAIAIVVVSALALVYFRYCVANVRDSFHVRDMYSPPAAWSSAQFSSPGFGLITAAVAAVALVGLGVTALVLEPTVREVFRRRRFVEHR